MGKMKAIFDNIKGTCEIEGKVPSRTVCEYDAKSKTLKVARDKIGEQSLYYAQLPTSVIVSTELKDILLHIAYPKINMLNLAQPIRYNYPVDLQQTWIEQIKRVRAGEELTIDQKGIRSRIYWKRGHTPTFTTGETTAAAGEFEVTRTLELPQGFTNGTYYLRLELTHPMIDYLAVGERALQINVNGGYSPQGVEYNQKTFGFLYL